MQTIKIKLIESRYEVKSICICFNKRLQWLDDNLISSEQKAPIVLIKIMAMEQDNNVEEGINLQILEKLAKTLDELKTSIPWLEEVGTISEAANNGAYGVIVSKHE